MRQETKVLKLAFRGFYKLYENDAGQYLVGVNMGIPFVIPIKKIVKRGYDKKWYIPADPIRPQTKFLLISDGSYAGASIIDLHNKYIIFISQRNNTTIHSHRDLAQQIELNARFIDFGPELVKEIARGEKIIRIYCVGKIESSKYVYLNSYTNNKDFYDDPEILRTKYTNNNTFIEFVEKEKCFVIRRWWKIEYI